MLNDRRLRIYIAGPYTRPDPIENTHKAIKVANKLWLAGYAPFVPHLSAFWHLVTPKPYEEWLAIDLEWLYACDAVYRMPGESSGADLEVARAGYSGIRVFTSMDELFSKLWNERRHFAINKERQMSRCEVITCDACGHKIDAPSVFVAEYGLADFDICVPCCQDLIRSTLKNLVLRSECTICNATGKIQVADEENSTASCGENRTAYKSVPCKKCYHGPTS